MLAFPKLSGLCFAMPCERTSHGDRPSLDSSSRTIPNAKKGEPGDESDPADHDAAADLGWEAVHQPLALPPGRRGTQRSLATLDCGHSSHTGVPDVRNTTQEQPNHSRDPLQGAHESIVVPA